MRSQAPSLLPVLRSQHQARLLAYLYLHPQAEPTTTDLARTLDLPLTTVHREVQRLVGAGLLVSRAVGRSRVVRADLDHRAAGPLGELLMMTFGPEQVVGEEMAGVDGADHVVVFGSWAARYGGEDGPPPRDVDVLVVGDVERDDVYDAAERATARLGLEVNPVVRTRDQWEAGAGADALVAQVRAGAHLEVAGRRSGGGR